jgi:hypothetical protein
MVLTAAQRALVDRWVPGAELVADLSWPEALTRVWHLRSGDVDAVVKAGGEVTGHHIGREIAAGRELTGLGDGLPVLIDGSATERVLALRYQPGALVQDTPAEADPAVFHAAGRLLARVHGSAAAEISADYPTSRLDRLRRLLPRASTLLDPDLAARAAGAVGRIRPVPEPAVRTHGDMQPRNWLVDDAGTVRLIDFGRYALRPAYTDLVRVVHRFPPGDPRVGALLAGLGGPEPWDLPGWWAENLYQAVMTVVWATDVGSPDFAEEGRGMLRRTLDGTMVR